MRATPLLLSVLLSAPAFSQVVINEVDYDQPSTDNAEFIELKNTGTDAYPMANVAVVLVNGEGGVVDIYHTYASDTWPSVAPGGYFTLCGDASAGCDANMVATNAVQNGGTDAIVLLNRTDSTVIDLLSYEGTLAGFAEGTGFPYGDDNTNVGRSIGRFPDGADTDDNATDFIRMCITPGATNVGDTVGCSIPTAITERSEQAQFTVFNDGASGLLWIYFAQTAADAVTFDVFSLDGSLVATRTMSAHNKATWAWPTGDQHGRMLLVRATNATSTATKRIVVP